MEIGYFFTAKHISEILTTDATLGMMHWWQLVTEIYNTLKLASNRFDTATTYFIILILNIRLRKTISLPLRIHSCQKSNENFVW